MQLNCAVEHERFSSTINPRDFVCVTLYVIAVEHQALWEARVFGFEWMSYDLKFGFCRVRTEFINSHPLREI